jgi:hypothetical protein
MSIEINRNGVTKYVNDDRIKTYIDAGWVEATPIKASKKKVETPVVESQPTVAQLDAVTEEQAENSKGE